MIEEHAKFLAQFIEISNEIGKLRGENKNSQGTKRTTDEVAEQGRQDMRYLEIEVENLNDQVKEQGERIKALERALKEIISAWDEDDPGKFSNNMKAAKEVLG